MKHDLKSMIVKPRKFTFMVIITSMLSIHTFTLAPNVLRHVTNSTFKLYKLLNPQQNPKVLQFILTTFISGSGNGSDIPRMLNKVTSLTGPKSKWPRVKPAPFWSQFNSYQIAEENYFYEINAGQQDWREFSRT